MFCYSLHWKFTCLCFLKKDKVQGSRFFILSYYIVKAAFLTLTGNGLGLGKKGEQIILSLSVHIMHWYSDPVGWVGVTGL